MSKMTQSPRPATRNYWLCQLIGWTVYVSVGLIFVALFPPGPPFWRFALIYAGAAGLAIACTHQYRAYIHRHRWQALSPARLLPRILAACLLLGTVMTGLVSGLYLLFFSRQFIVSGGWSWVFPALYVWMLSVLGWSLVYFGVHYFERVRWAEIEQLRLGLVARDSEIRALHAQINPHFIFNALNSIRALIAEDSERAQEMVTELASLLRYTLRSDHRQLAPLTEELEAVAAYLHLEAIRFEERLRVQIETEPAALTAALPAMLLQTLVENAVKHGIAALPEGGVVSIQAAVRDHQLRLQVTNTGSLNAAAGTVSTRFGLANARERLRLHYGSQAELVLSDTGAGRVVAEVILPADGVRT